MSNPQQKPTVAEQLFAIMTGQNTSIFDPVSHHKQGGGAMIDGVQVAPSWSTPAQPAHPAQQEAAQPTGATYDQIKAQLDQLQKMLRDLGADSE